MSVPTRRRRLTLIFGILVGLLLVISAITAGLMAAGLLPTPEFMSRRPAPFPNPATTRDGRWQQDIDYLGSQLPYLHVNAFHATSREAFEKQVTDLRAAVPTLNDQQIVAGMLRLIASVGDGHTRAFPHWSIGWRRFPIQVFWFSDGLYVIGAPADYQKAIGAKVTEIDGKDINAVFEVVKPHISSDNTQDLLNSSTLDMITPELLFGLEITASIDKATFSFQGLDGEQFDVELPSVPVDTSEIRYLPIYDVRNVARPLPERNRQAFYWYEYLPDMKTMYVQYNVCENMDGKPFSAFAKEVFDTIDAKGANRVILDMRYNGGGAESVLNPFIDGMAARSSVNAKDKFYVIIGRKTFSSALQNAMTLRSRTNATLVGEPTGGKPNHYGEVRQFKLPNSGLTVQYATRYWITLRDADPLTLEPDIRAEPSMKDVLAGHDSVLKAIPG